VAINSVPVDQSAFSRIMVVSIQPRMVVEFDQASGQRRETGIQATSKDGIEKKWTVEVVVSMASRWDSSRTESEVVPVTVTTAEDPAGLVTEGEQVVFDGLTVGVMPPEQGESGRIRGGKLFWSASGVRSRLPVGKS
jgi:hypothetical protein